MKLRTHLNLIVLGLSAALLGVLLAAEIEATSRVVREETQAANRVATHILGRVAWIDFREGPQAIMGFLQQLGHVRSNDITVVSPFGQVLYRSPPPTYKEGRDAPAWFSRWLAPAPQLHEFPLRSGGKLVVATEASRAVLDGWEDLRHLAIVGTVVLIAMNALAFWLVGHALRAFPVIAAGLNRIQQGDLAYRLPPLKGSEASIIGRAFNGMVQSVQEKVTAERQARDAEARLEERREMGRVVEQRIEEERRLIAHELHDEFSQSITAIRSMAVAIATQTVNRDPDSAKVARMISQEAAQLYDAMHGLIPRLVPLSLDTLGLAQTLENLISDWQRRYPAVRLSLQQDLSTDLGASVTLTIYRFVQEGLINALKHAQATRIDIKAISEPERVLVSVTDDGVGLPADWARPGHFGLRGLAQRVEYLGGVVQIDSREPKGVCLKAEIPLAVHA